MEIRLCLHHPRRATLTGWSQQLRDVAGVSVQPLISQEEVRLRARAQSVDLVVLPVDPALRTLADLLQREGLIVLGVGPSPSDGDDSYDDLLPAPLDPWSRRFQHWVEHARLRRLVEPGDAFALVWVGRSPEAAHVRQWLPAAAESSAPALIRGPPGTGKRLAAELLHAWSPRADGPFVAVSCRDLPETVLRQELFGTGRGVFSDDWDPSPGRWEEAAGGTLFLHHVEHLPPELQHHLLRRMAEQPDHTRVVASSAPQLETLVKDGRFRSDLLERLSTFNLRLTGLRQRPEDILPLARYFVERSAASSGRRVYLTEDAGLYLEKLAWRENVRELRNRLLQTVGSADGAIDARQLQRGSRERTFDEPLLPFRKAKASALAAFERSYLIRLLETERGHVTRAAERAEMHRKNLTLLLKKHGIEPRSFKPARPFGATGSATRRS